MIGIDCEKGKAFDRLPPFNNRYIYNLVKLCDSIGLQHLHRPLPCPFLPCIDEEAVYVDSDGSKVQIPHIDHAVSRPYQMCKYKKYLQRTLKNKLFLAYKEGDLGCFYSQDDFTPSLVFMSGKNCNRKGGMLTMKRYLEEEMDSDFCCDDTSGYLHTILSFKEKILNIMIDIQRLQLEVKELMVNMKSSTECDKADYLSGLYKKLEYCIRILALVFWKNILNASQHLSMRKFLKPGGRSMVTEWHLLQCYLSVQYAPVGLGSSV